MSCDIEAASPARPLHRVARRPDAWAWPDWACAGPDGTFGSRYDDPRGEYRVLYASSDRLGAFVEVLARFRPEPAVLRGLDEIELEPGARDDGPAPGRLPRSWLVRRVVGTAQADGPFAALGATRSLRYLRGRLSSAGRARAVYKHTGAGAGLACSDLGIPGASHTPY
jgi:RES domain